MKLGIGEEAVNVKYPKIYTDGLVTIGEETIIPEGMKVGKTPQLLVQQQREDYPDGCT